MAREIETAQEIVALVGPMLSSSQANELVAALGAGNFSPILYDISTSNAAPLIPASIMILVNDIDVGGASFLEGLPDRLPPTFIEHLNMSECSTLHNGLAAKADNLLFWSISTATAYAWRKFPDAFVETLQQILSPALTRPVAHNIKVAMHEAISNAIVHGNLGLPSMSGQSYKNNLRRFFEDVEHRLSIPENARKRISATANRQGDTLVISVADEGKGINFSKPHAFRANADPGQFSNRGLYIIDRSTEGWHISSSAPQLVLNFPLAPT